MKDEPGPQAGTPPDRRALIARHIEALNELADPATRTDGWTPFARKLFLSTLADTGRVTTACDYAAMTRQSAYALRARDPLFAAGWDAACELARIPLADALYERAVDGTTETLTRDDGTTVTRHRFDSRLSIAVLHRLDKRCDHAAERGAGHLGAVARWAEFTAAVGNGDEEAVRAIVTPAEAAPHCQACQLREAEDAEDQAMEDENYRIWPDEENGEWRTNFPPPQGFSGEQRHDYGAFSYSRTLAADELALVEADLRREREAVIAADAADRDDYFAALKAEMADSLELDPDPRSQPEHAGVEQQGDGDADGQRQPEAQPRAKQGRQQQEQGHRRQEEPEGARGELGDAVGITGVPPQPDEGQQRHQRQGDDQAADAGPAP